MSDRSKNILAAVAVIGMAAIASSRSLQIDDAPPLPHRQVVAMQDPPALIFASLSR